MFLLQLISELPLDVLHREHTMVQLKTASWASNSPQAQSVLFALTYHFEQKRERLKTKKV
jgi:hypothetical protein